MADAASEAVEALETFHDLEQLHKEHGSEMAIAIKLLEEQLGATLTD